MSFERYLAARYIKPKRRRGFLNLITVISVLGVALSVAGLIVVVSVMNGFDDDIRDKIIGTNSHVLVNAYGKAGIPSPDALVARIEGMPGVKAAAPFYQGQVMLKSDSGVLGVMLQGIRPEAQSRISRLKDNMREGKLEDLRPVQAGAEGEGPVLPKALIGLELARNLDVMPGQELTIFSPVFRMTPAGMMPRMAKVRVAGIFQTGYYEYDSAMVYMALEDAQELFNAAGVVNQIGVRLSDVGQAASLADRIQALDNGVNFWARDWLRMNQNLFKALQIEKLIMFIILGCMVVVAAFNIVSTLVMMVMEKQKEIGVLRSLGASSMSILKVFVYQGMIIGFLGGTLGFAAGLAVCWVIKIYPIKIPGGGSVYYIDRLPVAVQNLDLAAIAALTLGMCFLASLYPAWNASRMDPVEAIRYE